MTNDERAKVFGRGRAEVITGEIIRAAYTGGRIETTTLPDGRQVVIAVAVVPNDGHEVMARAFKVAYECATGMDDKP